MNGAKPNLFIDYPEARHLAVGDLIVVNNHWRRINKVDAEEYMATVELDGAEEYEHPHTVYGDSTPRIAGPILEALRMRGPGDPYR